MTGRRIIVGSVMAALTLAPALLGRAQTELPAKGAVKLQIPPSLKAEHEELHAELARITRIPGKLGEAAQAVAKVLHPHFVKEEEYALPPLGALSQAAQGRITPDLRAVVPLSDKLRSELPQMLAEHKAIVAALDNLRRTAAAEKRPEVAAFAEGVVAHAQTEEQVMYPSAIVLGEYLKMKLGK